MGSKTKAKPIETESTMMVARVGSGVNGKMLINGYKLSTLQISSGDLILSTLTIVNKTV